MSDRQTKLLKKINLALLALSFNACFKQEPSAIERTPLLSQFHYVKHGETVDSVAHKYKMNVSDLIHINQLNSPYNLCQGQKLHVHKRDFERDECEDCKPQVNDPKKKKECKNVCYEVRPTEKRSNLLWPLVGIGAIGAGAANMLSRSASAARPSYNNRPNTLQTSPAPIVYADKPVIPRADMPRNDLPRDPDMDRDFQDDEKTTTDNFSQTTSGGHQTSVVFDSQAPGNPISDPDPIVPAPFASSRVTPSSPAYITPARPPSPSSPVVIPSKPGSTATPAPIEYVAPAPNLKPYTPSKPSTNSGGNIVPYVAAVPVMGLMACGAVAAKKSGACAPIIASKPRCEIVSLPNCSTPQKKQNTCFSVCFRPAFIWPLNNNHRTFKYVKEGIEIESHGERYVRVAMRGVIAEKTKINNKYNVVVQHECPKLKTIYKGLTSCKHNVGDQIYKIEALGEINHCPNSKLHFTILEDNQPVDPLRHLPCPHKRNNLKHKGKKHQNNEPCCRR